MGKPLAFRPTEAIEKFIEREQEKHPKKRRSQIVVEALDSLIGEGNVDEYALYLKYPPNIICPADNTVYLLETILESCKSCHTRRNCPLWRRTSVVVKKTRGN